MAFANPIYENLDIKTKNNHLMLDPQLNSNYYLEREEESCVQRENNSLNWLKAPGDRM